MTDDVPPATERSRRAEVQAGFRRMASNRFKLPVDTEGYSGTQNELKMIRETGLAWTELIGPPKASEP
jgi:hypothetical protein